MNTLILTKSDLNSSGVGKSLDAITIRDFNVKMKSLYDAHCIVFLDSETPRIITLKSVFRF